MLSTGTVLVGRVSVVAVLEAPWLMLTRCGYVGVEGRYQRKQGDDACLC